MSRSDLLDIARECGLGQERWNTDQQLYDFIERYGKSVKRKERERCLTQVEREKQTWHFTSSSRAVRTACDNIIAMMRGDK